jgi:hypothetical protein
LKPLNYDKLQKDEFDAVVTGELTHRAIWLEHEVIGIITDYFVSDAGRRDDFRRLTMLRDGLTFQDKLEIARGMIPLLEPKASEMSLGSLLKRVEDFKAYRNAFAHGVDVSGSDTSNHLRIELVSRSGKERVIEVTPASHREMIASADKLLEELQAARKSVGEG